MKKFLVRVLCIIGAMTVMMLLSFTISSTIIYLNKEKIPDKAVLDIDFSRGVVEYIPDDPVAQYMMEKSYTLRRLVEAIETAAGDARVAGLVGRMGSTRLGPAHIQEIRDAVLAFRNSGKKTVAFADTFGEFGPGNGAYYLASAFEKIYIQPSGDIGLTGLMFETPFYSGTLKKLDMEPRLDHRKEYKNAMNAFTEDHYTEPHKEALSAVMTSLYDQIVRGIAAGRNIPEEEVRALVDRGPLPGAAAATAGLADATMYADQVRDKMKDEIGDDAEFMDIAAYLARTGPVHDEGKTIAVIHGAGGVRRGARAYNPVTGDLIMGSESVSRAFEDAIADEDVEAIIFRVDSPGGSYVASDTIWREVVRAKEEGKPVVVSMGNVAGSGGYFVAMPADKIVAQPGTITGSIGVLAGKVLVAGFWEKLGVSWDEIHAGDNADMWTMNKDYTPEQWEKLQKMLDRIYDDFTTKAAEGRGMELDALLKVAKGRIWTGEDAKTLGLVDELGGFDKALALAKEAARIGADDPVRLKPFPRGKTMLERVLRKALGGAREDAASRTWAAALKDIQPVARAVSGFTPEMEAEILAMPEMGLTW